MLTGIICIVVVLCLVVTYLFFELFFKKPNIRYIDESLGNPNQPTEITIKIDGTSLEKYSDSILNTQKETFNTKFDKAIQIIKKFELLKKAGKEESEDISINFSVQYNNGEKEKYFIIRSVTGKLEYATSLFGDFTWVDFEKIISFEDKMKNIKKIITREKIMERAGINPEDGISKIEIWILN